MIEFACMHIYLIFYTSPSFLLYILLYYQVEYYVKWRGFSSLENTWEPIYNLNSAAIRYYFVYLYLYILHIE